MLSRYSVVPVYLKVVLLLFGQRGPLFLPKVLGLDEEGHVDRVVEVIVQYLKQRKTQG